MSATAMLTNRFKDCPVFRGSSAEDRHLGKHPLRLGESIWDDATLEVFEVRLDGALSSMI